VRVAQPGFVVVTDRGGHLSNALGLLEQLALAPEALIVSAGPEAETLQEHYRTLVVPHLFRWFRLGRRVVDPWAVAVHLARTFRIARALRPRIVLSFGASATVAFCYWAWLLGARIVFIECMNQVDRPSRTGRLLAPICSDVFVQWKGLEAQYGPKGRYAGWVL
jgi:UDP-N-acetylglucosamine:LPS N-acetylglucosamine transferase